MPLTIPLSSAIVSTFLGIRTLKHLHIAGVSAELTLDQETLSGLIEAVYLVDDGEREKTRLILEETGYRRVEDFNVTILVTLADKREEIRIQVLSRPEPQQAHARGIKSLLPNHVVVIQGTNFRVSDTSDDEKVFKQDLHSSLGYEHIKETITSSIDKYKGDTCVA